MCVPSPDTNTRGIINLGKHSFSLVHITIDDKNDTEECLGIGIPRQPKGRIIAREALGGGRYESAGVQVLDLSRWRGTLFGLLGKISQLLARLRRFVWGQLSRS